MSAQKPDDIKRLNHIKDALDELLGFVQGFDEKSFSEDRKTFLSSLKLIEIIGEPSYHLSDAVKTHFSHIPWRQIEGMRHRLVHEYYAVDSIVAWRVATVYAPQLRAEIDTVLTFLQNES